MPKTRRAKTAARQPGASADAYSVAPKAKRLTLRAPAGGEDAALAEIAADPVMTASALSANFSRGYFGDVSVEETVVHLAKRVDDVRGGDLACAERMLVGQAAALNAIFTELARRMASRLMAGGGGLNEIEMYHRMVLRTQSHCRMTIEALGAIKNPPVVFARQANIASGPQQINNGTPARAREIDPAPKELLPHAQPLELGTTTEASGGDPALETVGAFNGTSHRKREGALVAERIPRRTETRVERTSKGSPGAARRAATRY